MTRADLMLDDVEKQSQKGATSVLLTKSDTRNKLKRYLLRNKRKAGMKIVAIVVLSVLAPPAALAYVGGAIAGYGVSRVRKWVTIHNARARIEESGGLTTTATIGKRTDHSQVLPETFAVTSSITTNGSLFQDLAVIVQREKLTDIFNTFSELERDYLQFKGDIELLTNTGVKDCDHAIRLWEGHFRYYSRYLDIVKNFDELDQAVVMAVINLSGLDMEFSEQFKDLLTQATAQLSEPEKAKLMLEATNHGTVFGHWNQRSQDRSVQLKAALQLAVEGSGMDLTSPLKTAGGALAGYAIGTGVGTAISATVQAVSGALHMAPTSLGVGPVDIANGVVSASAGGIVGSVEMVAAPVVEALNHQWNLRNYKAMKEADAARERIGVIRPLAKASIEKWATKLVHLNTQHQAMLTKYRSGGRMFATQPKRLEAAVDYLRWIKLRSQVQESQKFVAEFQDAVVRFTIAMDKVGSEIPAIEQAIRTYVDKDHPAGHCTHKSGSGFCYGSIGNAIAEMAKTLPDKDDVKEINKMLTQNEANLAKIPACAIVDHGGKEIFVDFLLQYYV